MTRVVLQIKIHEISLGQSVDTMDDDEHFHFPGRSERDKEYWIGETGEWLAT